MNALKSIANVVQDRWYDIADLGVIIGYHLKLAGIQWTDGNQLAELMIELMQLQFIEVNPDNIRLVKVFSHYIPKEGEAHEQCS